MPSLKNIRIKTPSVVVLSVEHFPRVLITWELEPTAQNLSNLQFFVDRGESPSEFTQLNQVGLLYHDHHEFVDETPMLKDLHKVYYYRLRAVEYAGGTPVQTFTSDAATWDGNLDLVGLYIVEEHLFALRHVYGVPAMIFKKRKDGTYCTECWDPVLKRVTKSTCTTCYGTGKVGGYYPPIDAWIGFDGAPEQDSIAEWGKRQSSQADVQFTNYPLLSCDDLIAELKFNRFWKVTNIRTPEKNRTTILQMARVDAANPGDIEYRIEVPEARKLAMLSLAEQREQETEF